MENRGKKNRVKIGQLVTAKKSIVDWYTDHLSWSYGRPPLDPSGYSPDQREIHAQDLPSVYFWVLVRLSGKMPTGVVTGYGARDNGDGVDRNNLWVDFVFETELGKFVEPTCVEEKSVVLVKSKSRKPRVRSPRGNVRRKSRR